jgi:hypothetical protein
MGFKREPKMMTTEPSVDEVGQSGGKMPMMAAKSRKGMPAGALAGVATRTTAPVRSAMQRPMGPAMKKGGEVESKAMHKAEDKKIMKVEKELKSHEGKSAAKGHKGLGVVIKKATGGVIQKYATGGVIQKYASGGVIQKYKEGGHVAMACSSGDGFKANKKGGSW